MSIIQEFKTFIRRGNVVEMAVGIIIGGAFGKIVTSLVTDILMPPIGFMVGGVHFHELKISMGGPPPVTLNYGAFLQTVFDFLIVSFCIFLVVKGVNALEKRLIQENTEAPKLPPEPTAQEKLLIEIRDLLKEKKQQ